MGEVERRAQGATVPVENLLMGCQVSKLPDAKFWLRARWMRYVYDYLRVVFGMGTRKYDFGSKMELTCFETEPFRGRPPTPISKGK